MTLKVYLNAWLNKNMMWKRKGVLENAWQERAEISKKVIVDAQKF